jgi:hypothetical protein
VRVVPREGSAIDRTTRAGGTVAIAFSS